MKQVLLFLIALLTLLICGARAVEIGGDQLRTVYGTFNTTEPTDSDISGWSTGWALTGITWWDYLGQVNGASGVYLGNGWVLTAGHVGAGQFTLDGSTYSAVANSAKSLTTTDGTTGTPDLTLFQIATEPNLPSLTIATTTDAFSEVVMLGYGGGSGRDTWGTNIINPETTLVQIGGWWSDDFSVNYSATAANVVSGDSGGGDFTFDHATGEWVLTGINEAFDNGSSDPTFGNSYMVELDEYASQINAITTTSVPEPGTWLFIGIGAILVFTRRLVRIPSRH